MPVNYVIRVLEGGPAYLTNNDEILVLDFSVALDGFDIILPDTGLNKGQHYRFVQKGQPATRCCTPQCTGNDQLWNKDGYPIDSVNNPAGINVIGGTELISLGDKIWVLLPP